MVSLRGATARLDRIARRGGTKEQVINSAVWADAAAQLSERWELDEDLDDEEGYPRR
ncbi:MAG: hypothetical protein ACRDX8_03340 [Acidimicrobiales bacterium]